jgi:hypothetical protein
MPKAVASHAQIVFIIIDAKRAEYGAHRQEAIKREQI